MHLTRTLALSALLAVLSGCNGSSSEPNAPGGPPPGGGALGVGPAACIDGRAAGFDCAGISLRRRVPLAEMNATMGNDIWGWTDPQDGTEYALMGTNTGTAFVDISSPERPLVVGTLPSETGPSPWRAIKVYENHAYVVADNAGPHGMQVFDLTRLRNAVPGQTFIPDLVYRDFENGHTIAVNADTGYVYVGGSNTCGGGLHMINVRTPNNPLFAGCHGPSYTHDMQCVAYRGPDARFAGREICVNSNENHVAIVDVTNKSAPVTLSTATYPQLRYVHQGWLSEDHRYFFLGDEFDELEFGVPTRTHVFDVSRLTDPQYLYPYEAETSATSHNLFVLGNRIFQANYVAGLRVVEFGDVHAREISEVAYFDTYPHSAPSPSSAAASARASTAVPLQSAARDPTAVLLHHDGSGPQKGEAPGFFGAWSVYPYFPSGNIVVSDISGGLFVLTLD